jgi:hypothetical protein
MRMHRIEYFKINENDSVVLELLQAVKNTDIVKQTDSCMPLLQTHQKPVKQSSIKVPQFPKLVP